MLTVLWKLLSLLALVARVRYAVHYAGVAASAASWLFQAAAVLQTLPVVAIAVAAFGLLEALVVVSFVAAAGRLALGGAGRVVRKELRFLEQL